MDWDKTHFSEYYPVVSGSAFNLLPNFLMQILSLLEHCLKSCGQLPALSSAISDGLGLSKTCTEVADVTQFAGALYPSGVVGERQLALPGASKVVIPLCSCALTI